VVSEKRLTQAANQKLKEMISMQTRFYDNKLKAVVARLAGGQRRIFLVTAMLMALVLVGTVAASVNFAEAGQPWLGRREFAAAVGPAAWPWMSRQCLRR
jgi:hypothetical protein